jgi:hypothetical protein
MLILISTNTAFTIAEAIIQINNPTIDDPKICIYSFLFNRYIYY